VTIQDLPAINATLNSFSTVFLLVGWYLIRVNRTKAHVLMMCCALLTSALFLTCYLTYHFNVPTTRFTAQGVIRPVYFALLISHTILAVIVLPLVIGTVIPALRAHYARHRWIGRWTLPVWLYVSITGVLVYMMLYQWYPPAKYAGF
jgi:putative membrane protein